MTKTPTEYHTGEGAKPPVKAWKCQNDGCDTILGVVDGGWLYPSEGVTVRLGEVAELGCPECEAVRTWHIGQEAIDRLLRGMEKRRRVGNVG